MNRSVEGESEVSMSKLNLIFLTHVHRHKASGVLTYLPEIIRFTPNGFSISDSTH